MTHTFQIAAIKPNSFVAALHACTLPEGCEVVVMLSMNLVLVVADK